MLSAESWTRTELPLGRGSRPGHGQPIGGLCLLGTLGVLGTLGLAPRGQSGRLVCLVRVYTRGDQGPCRTVLSALSAGGVGGGSGGGQAPSVPRTTAPPP